MPDALLQALNESASEGNVNIERLEQVLSTPSMKEGAEKHQVPFQPIEAIVAFIDILGTSSLMRSITPENATQVASKILGIKKLFEEEFAALKTEIPSSKLMVISDSFVISIPKEPDPFQKLIYMLAQCQYACLMSHNEIIRGAVAAGAIIGGKNDPTTIIGPAFIKAHDLETKNAIFPRIVVDAGIVEDSDICQGDARLPLVLDKDGFKYIDFLYGNDADFDAIKGKISDGRAKTKTDAKNLQKWHWLNTFLEQKTNACLDCCRKMEQIEIMTTL